jgi:hypothetical protein
MSERQKETRFLKTLIVCDDSEQGRSLQERIGRAEKDERCIRCAVCLVSFLALLCLFGLGYSAVFVPQTAHFSTHISTHVFCIIGLGSTICLVIFLGYWLWYRAVSNRVFEECRRFLRPLMESRLNEVPGQRQNGLYRIEARAPQDQPVTS